MYPIEITSYKLGPFTTWLINPLSIRWIRSYVYHKPYWLVVWNMNFIFHILGISSSQLTNLFQRGWNHQPENDGTTCRDMMECWNQGWKHAYLAYFLIFCFTLRGFSDILSEKGFIRNVIWDSVRAAQRARELGAGRKKRQTYLAGGKKVKVKGIKTKS